MGKFRLRKFVKEIHKDSEKEKESYGTGLLNEHIIVASFKKATDTELRGYRIIINKILNKRKIARLQENDRKDGETTPL